MKYIKPLLLVIPCLLILLVFFWIDEPVVSEPIEEPTTEAATTQTEQTEVAESGQTTQTSEKEKKHHPRYLTVLVGKTGTLNESYKDAFEPVYAEPDETSDPIAKLQFNCTVQPTKNQIEEDWYEVDLKGMGIGYVKKEAVEVAKIDISGDDPVRDGIITEALNNLGNKFKMNGDSLTEGVDCSHFISNIFSLNNRQVPDKPVPLSRFGTLVPEGEKAKPGDIVFYPEANNGYGHVGIFLGYANGEGYIINSSGHSGKNYPQGGVRICNVLYADRTSYEIYNVLETEEKGSENSEEKGNNDESKQE